MLAHVASGRCRSWPGTFEVVAPDLRGFGGSDAPDGGYDKKTVAADLHGLLDQLGLDR